MMRIFGPYKKRSRSASMQLSINAIVILVMAMAVLGLGLGLIRGVLGSGKDKLMSSLESMDLSEQATAEKPIANINNIQIKRNQENTLAVSFYNKESSSCSSGSGARLNISCAGGEFNWTSSERLPVVVDQGVSKNVGGIFKTEAPAKNYACTVTIECDKDNNGEEWKDVASESAFIEVTA
ncbi:MAG: hypothetical protein ACOCZV_00345 [Nanoarchaeota archaeon]